MNKLIFRCSRLSCRAPSPLAIGLLSQKFYHSSSSSYFSNEESPTSSVPTIPFIIPNSSSTSTITAGRNLQWPDPNLSPLDVEKELLQIKRRMGSCHSKGDYEGALSYAIELQDKVEVVYGTDGKGSAMYASALNNVALMQKLLGHTDAAMDKYTHALHLYEDSVGKKHSSYVSTLANVGLLFKSLAEAATSKMDKVQLIDRAKEALRDVIAIRSEISGKESKETLLARVYLASVLRLDGKLKEAEDELLGILATARKAHGDMDSLTATCLNNLGLLLKSQCRYKEARSYYEEALHIRSSTLGDGNPETIVSMHNLAEMLLASGAADEATKIQENILAIMEEKQQQQKTHPRSPPPSSSSSSSSSSPPSSSTPLSTDESSGVVINYSKPLPPSSDIPSAPSNQDNQNGNSDQQVEKTATKLLKQQIPVTTMHRPSTRKKSKKHS